jgi:uncharacterized protein (TIGR03067 family)
MSVIGIACALALLVTPVADADSQTELAKFEGVWSFSRVDVDGVKQPPQPFPAYKMIVMKDGRYVVVQGSLISHGRMKLDTSTTPKQIDCTLTDGPAKGKTFRAIYSLNGDTYRFCGALTGDERAKTLASAKGSGMMLQTLKREKQDAKTAMIEVCRKQMAGTWLGTSFMREGSSASEEELKQIKIVVDADGKITSYIGDKVFLAGGSTIDPSQDPMTLDVAYTEGVNKGKTSLGIYKLEDGVLTICRRPPGKPRPTEFTSEPGSNQILITYKREKTEPKK